MGVCEMKKIIMLIAALTPILAFAAPLKLNMQQQENAQRVMSVLGQSMSKQKQCAKLGYIGYQNALSAAYATGTHGKNTIDPVKAYAWNLVAYHQLLETKNVKLIKGQQKATHFIAKKLQLTEAQKHAGNVLANRIIKTYSKNWVTATQQMQFKDFPKPCNLK
jgi:hypothetical protein